ncbi:TonB-dependent receptor plug domain-containing protein, partial [Xanthomonas sp. SHU 199]
MHHPSIRLQTLALAVAAALSAPAALAQQATPAAADAPAAQGDVVSLDSVFVTGTATPKSKLKSSVSVSTVGAEAIEQSAPRSTAEIFRNIPGIRSESSGGEGNANIAVRGLPVASGGAKFLQLQEDGLPVLEFGDIAFGNADIFLRADYSLERIEAIRGGSASTFASNSPGGIINFISKTGDTAGGSVGLTRGLGGYDNTRLDFDYGAPFAEHWQFNVGGFYRRGDGVRDAGYTTDKGGQLKANLTRLFDNGYVRVYA